MKISRVRSSFTSNAGPTSRPMLILFGAMLVTALVAMVGVWLDPRLIANAPAWLKPARFAISFAIYAATLWLLLPALADRPWFASIVAWALLAGVIVEMALIALQAARGRMSHFNEATPFDTTVFSIMGTVVLAIWLVNLAVAAVFFRRTLATPALTWGVRLGFVGALIGMALAFLMPLTTPEQQAAEDAGATLTVRGAHAVGVPDGGPGLPILGWSTTGGDLRAGHFVGLHALQAIPLFALALARVAPAWLPQRAQAQMTAIFGAWWIALTLLLTWQALRGQPVMAPDGVTLIAFGCVAGAMALAIFAVLRRGDRRAQQAGSAIPALRSPTGGLSRTTRGA